MLIFCSTVSSASETPILEIDTGGHKAKIHDLMFTKDGRYLVSASEDKTVRIWDVQTGEAVRVLRGQIGTGYEGMIYSAALSPDSRLLAVGGFFMGIRLIDLSAGEIVSLLKGHAEVVTALAFSADNNFIVSGSVDKTARIWDVRSGQTVHILKGHADHIYAVAYSPKRRLLVTGSDDHTLRLWDADSGSLVALMKGHTDKVRAVVFTPDGKYIISGSHDDTIRIWDGTNGNFIRVLAQQNADVDSISVSPDSSKVLTGHGCCDPRAPNNVYEIVSGKKIGSFTAHDNAVFATAIAPDNRTIATGGGNNFEILLWDITNGRVMKGLAGRGHAVQAVGFSRDGSSIAWGKTERRRAKVFHLPALEQSFRLVENVGYNLSLGEELRGGQDYIRAFETAGPLSIRTADGSVHSTLEIVMNGTVMHEIKRDERSGFDHRSVTLTPDGQTIVSGGSGGYLASYRADTGEKLFDFIGHTGDILGVAPSPDGRYLISGSDDQTVRLWDVETGTLLLTIFQGSDREWVAWTPVGYYTASVRGDNYIGWHINQGENRKALFYPASRFAKQFYFPALVAKYMETGEFDRAFDSASAETPDTKKAKEYSISDIQTLIPPAVYFQSPAERAVSVSDGVIHIKGGAKSLTDEPINDIWLLVNGRRLDPTLQRKVSRKIEGRRAEIELSIPLTQKENRISIIASNMHSQSEPEIINVTLEADGTGRKIEKDGSGEALYMPDLYILAIGVSDYANPDYNLDSAHRDAIAVNDVFKTQKGGLYREVKIRLLVNKDATQDNILAGLDWLIQEATQKDTAIIFAAGHGLKDSRGNYYLLPYDGDPGRLRRTGVKWFDFEDVLTGLPSKVILMVDTCHSGSVTGKRRSVADMTETLRELTTAGSGVVVITASTGKEESQERPEWGHGAFTKALVEGLTGGADHNKDRIIDIKELDLYITYRVKELTDGLQHPTTEIPKTLPNFPVVAWN